MDCMARSKRFVYAGQRFGRLTVLDPGIKLRSGRFLVRGVLLRCACGTERKVALGSLLRGATRSCGCLNAENRRGPKPERRKHFVSFGQTFGYLTVIDPDRGLNEGSDRIVGVRCVCGQEKDVLLGNLVSGRNKTCGCKFNRVVWKRSDPDWQWRQYLWTKYHITPERYLELLEAQEGVCAICKRPPGERRLHVDHDHSCCPAASKSCGKCVRGLLCFSCNSKIGWLETFHSSITPYLTGMSA